MKVYTGRDKSPREVVTNLNWAEQTGALKSPFRRFPDLKWAHYHSKLAEKRLVRENNQLYDTRTSRISTLSLNLYGRIDSKPIDLKFAYLAEEHD